MSVSFPLSATPPLHGRGRWLLVAMHVPFFAFTIAQAGFGLAYPPPYPHSEIALPLVVLAGAIQLRHSLAAAAGMRPRYWRWSLLLLLVIADGLAGLFGIRWITLQWFVVASFAMLLPPRAAVVASIVSAVGSGIWFAIISQPDAMGFGQLAWSFSYWEALQFLGAVGLYGATRLVRLLDELRDARGALAELAISRERVRISRDLHDLLGQSLSAVSLKGDLAIGLLERRDRPRAVSEIESLVSIARSALHDLRDIAHGEPRIALASEIERVTGLLASTGAETRVDVTIDRLSPATDELFAWALREGVTNVLRHSTAGSCSISIQRDGEVARLEIVNDGAMPAPSGGNGLSGLAARASALAGTATGHLTEDGHFRLRVEVPG